MPRAPGLPEGPARAYLGPMRPAPPELSPEAAMSVVAADPQSPAAWEALALAWDRAGRADVAEPAWARLTQLSPRSAFAWAGRSLCLRRARRFPEALAAVRRAALLAPGEAWVQVNLSAMLLLVDAYDEALAAAQRATALEPADPAAWGALHNAAVALGDTPLALAAVDRAAALDPADPRLRWNRSLCALSAGDWATGWAGYEARLERPGARLPPDPRWDGRAGPQRLLVTLEQGLGDTVQLLHLLGAARARVDSLTVAAPIGLQGVLRGVPGVDRLVEPEAVRAGPALFDVAVALPSLPALLGTRPETAAVGVPALQADPAAQARWAGRLAALAPGAALRVGLCWQGNPSYEADHRRSPGLMALGPLGAVPGVGWFSLQKVHGQLAEQPRRPFEIHDLDPELDADGVFCDTIPCLAALDLLITGDTALAHLAGQLGRPVWLALCWAPDWRWGRAGEGSPWYPSMRVFRQPRPGDWRAVYTEMAAVLASSPPARPAPNR